MNNSQRVFANTIAQYLRTIINMVLSLYTVRLVLMALGQSDFGIYYLVAGVVSMLSFVTLSLVTTTQRFISFYQGKGQVEEMRKVFNNSLIIHIVLGISVAIVLESLSFFLFNGFFNIPPERIASAYFVFQTVLLMLFLSFITAPFRALLISHEDIVYISTVDVLDGIIKVVLAILLLNAPADKLQLYGVMMASVQLFNFMAFSVFSFWHYEECGFPRIHLLSRRYILELLSFAGWSTYGTGCVIVRQQGIAIVLNRLMGTVVNAAYGIAFQIASYTNFLSAALSQAMSPQIVKSEGAGDRERALRLTSITCKFMFFLLSAIGIPYLFEVQGILEWWLDEVPEYAALFCMMAMFSSMADVLTYGFVHINQAIGRIRFYSIVVNTPKILTLVAVYLCLQCGGSLQMVVVVYVLIELFSAVLRLPIISHNAGLDIISFLRKVIAMEVVPALLCTLTCYLITHYVQIPYRFIITFAVSIPVYTVAIYFLGLTSYEHTVIRGICCQMFARMAMPLNGHNSSK
jgi:O-antigen/teichoic acid export membrane protein